MTSEAPTVTVETGTPPEYAFADIDAIEQLRAGQQSVMFEAGKNALAGLDFIEAFNRGAEVRDAAECQAAEQFDSQSHDYVSNHLQRDDNPELFDNLVGLVRSTSADKMTNTKWELGDPDETGEYTKPETSGKAMVKDFLSRLRVRTTEAEAAAEVDPLDIEAQKAADMLYHSRIALADLSISRRQTVRKGGRKARELAKDYEAAEQKYQQARIRSGQAQVALMRRDGKSNEEISTSVIRDIIEERHSFTKAELGALNKSKSERGPITRFLANHMGLVAANVAGGAVIGWSARKISGSVIKGSLYGFAPAVAVGAGLAMRGARAILMASVGAKINAEKHFGRRANADIAEFDALANAQIEGNHDQMLNLGNDLLVSHIAKRVEQDRRYNLKRTIAAAALSGAMSIGGAILADNAPLFEHAASHHPTEGHAAAGTPHHESGSGSHSGNGSGGNTSGSGTGTGEVPAAQTDPTMVDGYHTNVIVENGHGYTQELQELAAQKGINLSGADSWNLYTSLNSHFNGNFFTNDTSYLRSSGDWGISHPGQAIWRPEVVAQMEAWLKANSRTS